MSSTDKGKAYQKKTGTPAPHFYCAKNWASPPAECLYVGDSGVDMQTGQNAGLFTAGVTWGFRDEKELEENGADTLVHNAEELENLIL